MAKKRSSGLIWLIAVGVVGAGVWYAGNQLGWFEAQQEQVLDGAAVRRGPLTITVSQRGNIEAKNSHRLRSRVEGRATILTLVPEGKMVEAGELVAELDASGMEDDRVTQEIQVQAAISSLTKAEQNLEIQKSQNASDIARAQQTLEFAEADLRKYLEGDWPQQQQQADEEIVLAKEELKQAQDTLDWSRRLAEDGFLTRTQLEQDELTFDRRKILLEQAERRKTLLIDFDNPKQEATLNAAVEEAQRELERVKLQAKARLIDYQDEVRTATARKSLEEEQLAKLLDQINAANIYAPAAGMVVYGRTEGRYGGSGDPIQEGTEVRERQEVITIPRSGSTIVEASLHESVLKKVQVGLPCKIRIDALPNIEFTGQVDYVARLADKGSWWANPNQRVYRTEISINEQNPDMRPGLSCNVEILIAHLEDVLYIPVQSVIYHGNGTICFVSKEGKVEERVIEVGKSSDKWAEVQSGLTEGEVVLLSPPPGFKPEPAETGPETEFGPQGRGFGGSGEASVTSGRSKGTDSSEESRGGEGQRPREGRPSGESRRAGSGPSGGFSRSDSEGKPAASANSAATGGQ